MRFFKKTRGFTLMELLVVLGIVGLLASVVIFNIQAGKEKARDIQRVNDAQQIQIALRLYKDINGVYPASCPPNPGNWRSPGPGSASWYTECNNYIYDLITEGYLPVLPVDPNSEDKNNGGYMYRVSNDGSEYKLLIHGVVEGGTVNAGEPFARCPASCSQSYCSQKSYAVYSTGAACW